MKPIQHDGMWIMAIGIALMLTYWFDYNVLTLSGAIMMLRGIIGIIITFVKQEPSK